jgi:hypothetical protein
VRRRRRVLDIAAAGRALATGDAASAGAIRRAWRDFERMRPAYADTKPTTADAAIAMPLHARSIVADYYVRGRRRFSDLV